MKPVQSMKELLRGAMVVVSHLAGEGVVFLYSHVENFVAASQGVVKRPVKEALVHVISAIQKDTRCPPDERSPGPDVLIQENRHRPVNRIKQAPFQYGPGGWLGANVCLDDFCVLIYCRDARHAQKHCNIKHPQTHFDIPLLIYQIDCRNNK